jgi:DNA-binding NarL/FixJ family response regulator
VINEALVVEGQSNRAIAGQYGLGRESVRRHRAHIPELLLKARDDLEGYERGPKKRMKTGVWCWLLSESSVRT